VFPNNALHMVLCQWNPDMFFLKFLIKSGADLHGVNKNGARPIDVAIESGKPALVDYLLSLGIKLPEDSLKIALKVDSPVDFIRFLIERGASLPNNVDIMNYEEYYNNLNSFNKVKTFIHNTFKKSGGRRSRTTYKLRKNKLKTRKYSRDSFKKHGS
jgi:ankyrin repeat protein